MSITSSYALQTFFTEDFLQTQLYSSTTNTISPGGVSTTTLASGNNAIVIPAHTTGFAIVPPASNTLAIAVKGTTADTGLSVTGPTILGVVNTTSTTSCTLTASGTITGVRLIFL